VSVACRRLDGIPLAIELAAARVRSLSLVQIAKRLDDRFRLLTQGNRAAPARHRTLRAAIDWSYRLLSDDERILLGRLAVFSGGWTPDAAEAVCAAPPLRPADVPDLVSQLVEKSLAIAEDQGAEPRYRMLETVRAYARERLAESGDTDAVFTRHRDWYLALAERADPELRGPGQGAWLERLETELDNLRAALAWSRDRNDKPGALLRLAAALERYWFVRGRYTEGRRWLDEALDQDRDAEFATVLKALDAAGHFARQQGDYVRATALAERGLALARERNDKEGTAMFLGAVGVVAALRGDFRRAEEICERSLALWRELGDTWQISAGLRELGAIANLQGKHEEAAARCTESLSLARQLGDKHRMAFALKALGDVALRQQDIRRATAFLAEGLALSRDTGNLLTTETCLEGLAEVALAEGRHDRAARLVGAAEAMREVLGRHRMQANQHAFEACIETARAVLRDPAFGAAWKAGQSMTAAEAVEFALVEPGREAPDQPAASKKQSAPLAPREREVAALIARGLTNRDIAVSLEITERTAETHVQHILNKLGFGARAQIAAWAVEQGLLRF
jgi:DNA-binding CsgD family transcriptional regulator/tetratricopeptide (TPR) repeat protein